VSATGHDFAKGTILTLIPTGLGFIVSGWLVGVLCLFVAGSLSLVLWTPIGAWLGFHGDSAEPDQPSGAASGHNPTFVAVEAEVALAHEEAIEMTKLLRSEWPHITPEGAVVEVALPDWKNRTANFIGTVLDSAQRAAFKGSSAGDNVLERLESEGKFLSELALRLTPDSVRASESEVLEARRERRSHQAANFLTYDHSRAPGAPPKVAAPATRESTTRREFARRDDRGDLAKRCHMFAASVERWVQAFERGRSEATGRMAQEALDANPDLDPAEARRWAAERYEKNWEADYRLKYDVDARDLFVEAWELHEVAKELEDLAVEPFASEFAKVPQLFNEIAESLYAEAA